MKSKDNSPFRHGRRTFLKALGVGAGAAAFGGPLALRRALAMAPSDRRFIFAYFSGGWDTLIGLDPRDPGLFNERRIGETLIQPAYDRLPGSFGRSVIQPKGSRISFGPAMAAFARHYDKSCVVRGVAMDTVTHVVGERYFLTGRPPSGQIARGSAMGTRIVAQQGDISELPNLVFRMETYAENVPAFANGIVVASINDLRAISSAGTSDADKTLAQNLAAYQESTGTCDSRGTESATPYVLARAAQRKAGHLIDSGLGKHFDFFNRNDPEMVALKTRYNITGAASLGAQAASAFQALRYDVSQAVTVRLARNLDTHSSDWAPFQAVRQAEGWKLLATLVDDLTQQKGSDGKPLLENTTIVVFSEFARTPKLNSKGGRDHHLASSTLLIGAGVPHNKVVGATSDQGMNPLRIDPRSGSVTKNGVQLTPSNILASVMKSADLDVGELRADPIPALIG